MSRAEAIYQEHLDLLRKLADEKGMSFVDILCLFNKSYRPGLATCVSKSSGPEQIKRAEQTLIDSYRMEYFEKIADTALKWRDDVLDAVNLDTEQIKKIKEKQKKTRRALKATEMQDQNLMLGRNQGATKNKKRASAVRCLALQLNNDLLKHTDSARWSLDERATYIAKKLALTTVEIDGHAYPASMVNGKKYSSSTVKTWIIGT